MKLKVFVIGVLTAALVIVYIKKTTVSVELVHPIPHHIENPKPSEGGPEFKPEVMSHIKAINGLNQKNKSLASRYATVEIKCANNMPVTLRSLLVYEKDKNFRMINRSTFGRETDMGSNDDQFWFWSRRMEPPTLYYASHTDLIKTPLRPPLNPLWLMECMGVEEITTKNSKARKHDEYWAIYQTRVSNLGTLLTKMTLIDPHRKRIIGHYLYDADKQLMASNEVVEFVEHDGVFVPIKTKMCWHEEGVVMIFDFSNIEINSTNMDSTWWTMPNMRRKQDMTKLTP